MIERSHPGVCLSEIASSAKPIDRVSTDPTGIDRLRSEQPVEAPPWTDANASDPGITLVELLGWISEFTVYGGPAQLHDPLRHIAVAQELRAALRKVHRTDAIARPGSSAALITLTRWFDSNVGPPARTEPTFWSSAAPSHFWPFTYLPLFRAVR